MQYGRILEEVYIISKYQTMSDYILDGGALPFKVFWRKGVILQ